MVVLGSPPGVPQSGGPVILELPLDKIRRPLMRTRTNDSQKVKDLMDSIKEIGLQVPVKVFVFFLILLISQISFLDSSMITRNLFFLLLLVA